MVNVNGVLNHYDLSGHVAVVTGGTKGIGRHRQDAARWWRQGRGGGRG